MPAGSASFGSIRQKGPTRVLPTATRVTTNLFNLSSYRGRILESIIPTLGIIRAISSEGKMSCYSYSYGLTVLPYALCRRPSVGKSVIKSVVQIIYASFFGGWSCCFHTHFVAGIYLRGDCGSLNDKTYFKHAQSFIDQIQFC